ncbi:GtrA family protein [Sedimentibacter sp. B4]|uniref:GtrA family protein n=1 Tax=Sedimentibacter sp. B4 TaxID=304766 RepID=UPI0002D9F429|nr:GtrA family protein [Sedimentibacter sp. B4]
MNNKMSRELISYLVAGILTTLVNFLIYYVLIFFGIEYKAANTTAFLISVIFAFFINKKYVFLSNKESTKEFMKFFSGRIFTYALDIGTMMVLVELLGASLYSAKIWANAVVMVSNYLLSKFWIFK